MTSPATLASLLALTLALSGCVSLSRSEKDMLRELKSHGISPTAERVKHPGVAGGLNVLPGFGNFYLAAGTDAGEQWVYGFLNLLFWPISVLWAIPEAAIDADIMNKKETIYYYKFDREGKEELARLKSGFDPRQTDSSARHTDSSTRRTHSSTRQSSERSQIAESIRPHCISKWQADPQHQQSCIKRMYDGWQEVGNALARYPTDSQEYRMMSGCWSQWFPQMDRVASCTHNQLSDFRAHGSRKPIPANAIDR